MATLALSKASVPAKYRNLLFRRWFEGIVSLLKQITRRKNVGADEAGDSLRPCSAYLARALHSIAPTPSILLMPSVSRISGLAAVPPEWSVIQTQSRRALRIDHYAAQSSSEHILLADSF